MKKIYLFAVLLIIQAGDLMATEGLTQTIRGSVSDEITGYPLIGAYVIVLNSEPRIGSVTDINGKFEIKKVPVGRQSI
jgi:hypothetical protein